MPSMLDMGVAYNSWVNEGMDKEVYPGVTSRDLYDIVIGSGAGVVKTASTATKLFTGWRDNLSAYMLKASKKERKIADYIIRKAMLRVDESDVRGTQNLLNAINKEYGLAGKVVVPEIQGAAGGAIRQATKKKGAQIQSQAKGTKWRKQQERKATIAAKKKASTGDEPYSRGTQKLDD